MNEPTVQVTTTTSVSVDKDGLTRLTETRREAREPGRGHDVEHRTSRRSATTRRAKKRPPTRWHFWTRRSAERRRCSS
jgi:hypothetical protein